MKKLLLFALALFQLATIQAQSFFDDVDAFMGHYVSNGLVDYETIKTQPSLLNGLLSWISSANVDEMAANERKAFYVNAYNVLVINSVVDNYPTNSPLDVQGFFKENTHSVAGKDITLDQLENEFIYGEFPDARLHFALVCAAIGCPPIIDEAYRPETLDKQLNERTSAAVNSEKFVQPISFPKGVKLSQIFEWYADDFKRDGGSVIGFINQYRDEKLPNSSKFVITYSEYDWTLNNQ